MRSRPILFLAGALAGGLVAVLVTLAVVGWPPTAAPEVVPPSASPAPPVAIAVSPTPTPIPTHAVSPMLRVGGLATVVPVAGVRLLVGPGDRRQTGPDATIPAGSLVMLDARRSDFDGRGWWAIAPADRFLVYGWVAATDAHGGPTLAPSVPVCPDPDTVDDTAIVALGPPTALTCFGNRELLLRGIVRCDAAAADMAVAGAGWLDEHASCSIDGVLALDGPVVAALLHRPAPQTTAIGRYEVRGHLDDADARSCFTIPFGMSIGGPVSPPEPAAVLLCRQLFVVTSLTPLG